MAKLIGYVRVSTKGQATDRQIVDLIAAVIRKDDVYVDHGVSGGRARRPGFDAALDALQVGDTPVVATLDHLGRSAANMLELAGVLRSRGPCFAC